MGNFDLVSAVAQSNRPETTTEPPPPPSRGWFFDNIYAPASNAWIDMYNTAGQFVGLPHVALIEAPQAQAYSPSWYVQSAVGGVAGLVPYVIAGKLTGGLLRSFGGTMEMAALRAGGTAAEIAASQRALTAARIIASDRTAMILGAGIYDYYREPRPGESRVRNALGGMLSFSIFELGNIGSHSLPLITALPSRFAVGFAGGAGGHLISHFGQPTDEILKAGVSGAFMNSFLPGAQRGAHWLGDVTVNRWLHRGSPVGRVIESRGWDQTATNGTSTPEAQRQQSPFTRVEISDAAPGPSINHRRNIIQLRPGDGPAELAHEQAHRLFETDANTRARYEAAGRLADPHSAEFDPQQAWNAYLEIRLDGEIFARQRQRQAATERGQEIPEPNRQQILSETARGNTTYEQQWRQEFQRFLASEGRWRPEIDHSGQTKIYPVELDGVRGLTEEVLDMRFPMNNVTVNGEIYHDVIRLVRVGEYQGVQFRNGATLEFYGAKGKTVEPYGVVFREEHSPDQTSRYYVRTARQGFVDGEIVESYPYGTTTEHHEAVTLVERLPNGDVVYTKVRASREAPLRQGWDYADPSQHEGVRRMDQRIDGSNLWEYENGNTLEQLPSDRPTRTTFGDVAFVQRGTDGTVTFITTDNTRIEVARGDGHLIVSRTPEGGETSTSQTTEPIIEHYAEEFYPTGRLTARGTVRQVEYHPDFVRYHRTTGSAVVDDYHEVRTSDIGPVKYVVHYPDRVEYWRPDNSRYRHFNEPRRMHGGLALAQEIDTNGNETTHYQDGRTTLNSSQALQENYPNGLATSLGTFVRVDRTVDTFIYTRGDGTRIEVPMAPGATIVERTPEGIRDLRSDTLLEDYGDGKQTQFGIATRAEIKTDGTITYTLRGGCEGNTNIVRVTEYIVPRQTEQGPISHVYWFRDGTQRASFI